MRSRLGLILLGIIAFAIALLVVFPAAWVQGLLAPQLTCGNMGGSIWRGQCNAPTFAPPGQPAVHLDALDWRLHALSLLRGRVHAEVAVSGADLAVRGQLAAQPGGYVELTDVSGRIALDHARLAALPAGWSARAEASHLSVGIAGGRITRLGGVLLVRQVRDARGTAFGDFKLDFPQQDAPAFRGTLTDDGGTPPGPLQLQSQLVLNADRSWQLRGTVILRPGSPQGIAGALDQLAPADLNGVRNFSLEGTAD